MPSIGGIALPAPWSGQGITTVGAIFSNPLAGTVLADLGPLPAGHYRVAVTGAGNTGQETLIEHRDATNSTTLETCLFPITLSLATYHVFGGFKLAVNERIRVIARADVTTGEVQVTLQAEAVP